MLGLFVQKHARAVQLLHDVTLIYVTADSTLKKGELIIDEQNHFGIHEIRIYFGKYKTEIRNAIEYIIKYFTALKLAKKHSGKFDLTHVHILSRTAFLAMWLKITEGIPFVITEHWSRYLPVNIPKGSYSGWLRNLFTKVAVNMASSVTTVTANLADAMQNLGLKNKYYITPNIADMGDFYPLENKKNESIKKLVHVSCFDEPAKNVKGIIDVVNQLATKRNDFIIEIVGDGKDFNEVYNYALKTNLVNSRIYFTGLLTGKELSAKMRNADAFVMFSNYENFPCTIVESFASGVPVISSDVGGISEHLKPEFGILVEAGNKVQLEHAFIKIMDEPSMFNYKMMREYAKEKFSIEQSAKLFSDIYHSAGIL